MASNKEEVRENISDRPQRESHPVLNYPNQAEKQKERDTEAQEYAVMQEEMPRPIGGRRSLFRPDTEKQKEAQQWQQHTKLDTDASYETHRNNYRIVHHENGAADNSGGTATRTITLMQQEIHRALPTLVLKLNTQNQHVKDRHQQKMKNMTEQEQEQYFHDALKDFERMLARNVDEFRQTVMSARPDPKDPEYREKKVAYIEYVKGATLMVEHMRKTITDLLTRYRLFLDDVWEAITNGNDPTPVTRQFQENVDNYIEQRWDPIFHKIDQLEQQVEGTKSNKQSQ
ncbi:unnamed protein product [Adineta steineri]|uniref:Uncharacterized protein n=1 Tax=Adineta steineri TaxID=433720 RepID=A0A815JSN8_9BILA|nr:unnamed protein product [Adineta steineri]CAF1383383.1 unnamed protein product [Adineta steineri]